MTSEMPNITCCSLLLEVRREVVRTVLKSREGGSFIDNKQVARALAIDPVGPPKLTPCQQQEVNGLSATFLPFTYALSSIAAVSTSSILHMYHMNKLRYGLNFSAFSIMSFSLMYFHLPPPFAFSFLTSRPT